MEVKEVKEVKEEFPFPLPEMSLKVEEENQALDYKGARKENAKLLARHFLKELYVHIYKYGFKIWKA